MVAAARSKDTDTFRPAGCVRINGTTPGPARGKVLFLVGKIGWDGLAAVQMKRAL